MRAIRPALLVVCLAARLCAADPPDLQRVTPVPGDQPIPIQDYFRPPLFSGPVLNSDGTRFAAFVDQGDHTALLTCALADMKTNIARGSASKDLYALHWLDKSHVITSWSNEKLYADGLLVVNAARPDEIYPVESKSATILVGVPRNNPMQPLVWIQQNAYDDGKDAGVVRLDASKNLAANRDAGVGHPLARQDADAMAVYGIKANVIGSFAQPAGVAISYLADKDGQLAFAVTAENGLSTLQRLNGRHWVKCPVDLDEYDIVGAGDGPNELIVVGPRQQGKPRALLRLDAATGAAGQVLLQDTAYDPTDSSLYRNPTDGKIAGVRFDRNRPVTAWFDPSYQKVQALLEARFPAQVVQIMGSDEAENHFFVAVYSDRQPVVYYTLDLAARTIGLVQNAYPWIDPARMAPMNLMRFKTRDGVQLEGLVTLPKGASKQHPCALVVLPHGGPWVRDTWGFDPEAQFLASRGYAVLQPNYRGSSGYGWLVNGDDEWNFRKMHEDVTDSVNTLLSTGYIDPSRVAIMGGSFGGYLAICGAAFEPDRYRCAITISGVFDWAQVMNEAKYDQYTTAKFGILRRFLGDPAKRADFFDSISPLRHIDQVKIPVFVAHGKDDSVADVAESRALLAALEKFHVPHESMIVGGEGHGMQYLKNQVDLHARLEAFLAKNLAPAAPH